MTEPERTTVHFLYYIQLPTDAAPTELQPQDADTTAVAFQPEAFVRDLVDSGAYEHELAKVRLEVFLSGPVPAQPALTIV